MNPRAGDTVTLTKSTKRTTKKTTSATTNSTTGEQQQQQSGRQRRTATLQPLSAVLSRKRRQDAASEQRPQQQQSQESLPENNHSPPEKKRPEISSKSRFGDFLFGLAAHIRGPKPTEPPPKAEEIEQPKKPIERLVPLLMIKDHPVEPKEPDLSSKRRKLELPPVKMKPAAVDSKLALQPLKTPSTATIAAIETATEVAAKAAAAEAAAAEAAVVEAAAEAAAKVAAAEVAAKVAAAEAAAKVAAAEAAAKLAEEETAAKLAEEETAAKLAEKETAAKLAEEEAARKTAPVKTTATEATTAVNGGTIKEQGAKASIEGATEKVTTATAMVTETVIDSEPEPSKPIETQTNKEALEVTEPVSPESITSETSVLLTSETASKKGGSVVLSTETASCSSSGSGLSWRQGAKPSRRVDDVTRLRKTIQWLEEGGRRLREELASARSELHEERRAAKVAKCQFEAAIREAKNEEAAKHSAIVSDLKARLSKSPSRSTVESLASNSSKSDFVKSENHKREMAALKRRLCEAEATIQKLKAESLDHGREKKSNRNDENRTWQADKRKLELEVQYLRNTVKKIEEKLQLTEESVKSRISELRKQREEHETETSNLRKAQRIETIKLCDEIQSKNREIEKLEKLVNEYSQLNKKLRIKDNELMRKLRENERSHQLRLAPKIEEKIHHDEHVVDLYKVECEEEEEEEASVTELERLKELAVEQQEVIEVLRQAVKEKERKLEQLSNKRRKEEFYKQWLELEPVVEVEDEDDHEQQHNCIHQQQLHEEGDSAVSSAPPSLSPQPGSSCSSNGGQRNSPSGLVSREAYESLLLEVEELQTKLLEEQQELGHAKSQVRDLERALLQETRGSQSSRRALGEKLRDAEERESSLVAELSELREQNELLEFRVLELEESPNQRDTPDPADSGIVSPEPIHLYKDHPGNKHRDRAVATVIPYSSSYTQPILAVDSHKAPLSLQESGIFEEDVEDEEDAGVDRVDGSKLPCTQTGTQTEAPAGELLQEVQRLQELRARIQERAAKVPLPVSPVCERKNEASSCDLTSLELLPLRARVHELEERLGKFEAERKESKMREEELLDENYRITERTYCLEAELRQLRDKMAEVRLTSDAETMTDRHQNEEAADQTDNPAEEEDGPMSRCQKIYRSAIRSLAADRPKFQEGAAPGPRSRPCSECSELWENCDARIHQLARTEFCLRQQIASLEQREGAFFETLRQADATWAKLEADYEAKQKDMTERLDAQVELNRALFEHLTKLNKSAEPRSIEAMDVDGDDRQLHLVQRRPVDGLSRSTQTEEAADSCAKCELQTVSRSSVKSFTGVSLRTESSVSSITRTSIHMAKTGFDEIDGKSLPSTPTDVPMEVATEAKEDEPRASPSSPKVHQLQQQPHQEQQGPQESGVVGEGSSDKKQVIYFRWR